MQSQPIGKDLDAGEDWRQEEKGATDNERVGWHHQHNGHEVWVNSSRQWRTGKPGVLQSMGSQSQTQLSEWTTTRTQSPLAKTGTFFWLQSCKETSLADHQALRTEYSNTHSKECKVHKISSEKWPAKNNSKEQQKPGGKGEHGFQSYDIIRICKMPTFQKKKKKKVRKETGRYNPIQEEKAIKRNHLWGSTNIGPTGQKLWISF